MTQEQIITKALGLALIANATSKQDDKVAFEVFCKENDLSVNQLQNLDGAGFYIKLAIMTNPKTKSVYEDMKELARKIHKKNIKRIDEMLADFNAQV